MNTTIKLVLKETSRLIKFNTLKINRKIFQSIIFLGNVFIDYKMIKLVNGKIVLRKEYFSKDV